MVQRLPPVPTLDPGRFVGADPGGPERKSDRAGCTSDDRQHSGPRPSSGSGRKRGLSHEAPLVQAHGEGDRVLAAQEVALRPRSISASMAQACP